MYKDGGEECLSKRTTGGSRKGEEYLKREEKVITGSRKWGWGGGEVSLKNGGRGEIYVRKAKKQMVKESEKRKKARAEASKESDEKIV